MTNFVVIITDFDRLNSTNPTYQYTYSHRFHQFSKPPDQMKHIFTYSKVALLCALFIFANQKQVLSQGFIDFRTATTTPWTTPGAVFQTYSGVGSPAVDVTITMIANSGTLINNSPLSDSRGLLLNTSFGPTDALGSNSMLVTITFTPAVNDLSMVLGDIDLGSLIPNSSGQFTFKDAVSIAAFSDANASFLPDPSRTRADGFITQESIGTNYNLLGINSDGTDNSINTVGYKNEAVRTLFITFSNIAPGANPSTADQNIWLRSLAWTGIIPVQLMFFKGQALGNQTKLTWATATELNSDFFVVERSLDLVNYESIGQIKSAGNSRTKIDYKFTDEAPLPGINYYRLKQVDRDGSKDFSKIVAVNVTSDAPTFVIYPNPADGERIQLRFDNIDLDGIRITDMMGRDFDFRTEASNDNSLALIPRQRLQAGLYVVSFANQGKQVYQKLWIK